MTTSTPDLAQMVAQLGGSQAPGLAQTFDRRYINSSAFVPTSQTLYMSGIWLPAGITVTNIVCFSGGTGVTTNGHFLLGLYTSSLALLAGSTDDTTSTDFAANTRISKALTAAQLITSTGLYYIGYLQSASTPNTVLTAAAPASSIANADVPVVSASSSTSQTALPTTAGSLTAIVQSIYAYVS